MHGARRLHARTRRARRARSPARSASSSPTSRASHDAKIGDTITDDGAARATTPFPGFKEVKPMVFAGIFPIDAADYENLRDALDEAAAQRRGVHLRARDLDGARLRLPLRLPRPAPHGDRPGAARARVQPRPDHHRADASSTRSTRPTASASSIDNPAKLPAGAEHRAHRGADHHAAHIHVPQRVRRRDPEALPGAARHAEGHRVPGSAATACRSPTSCRSPRWCSTSTTS